MFMDRALSCRLERAEGLVGSSFIEVNQRLKPAVGVAWRDFGGTYAMFDGVDSPLTQTFGLGMLATPTPGALGEIEAFFIERGAAVMHEISPLAGVETVALVAERGYRPFELSTVLVQPLDGPLDPPAASGLRTRTIEDRDHDAWIETSVVGWASDPTYAATMREMATGVVANRTMVNFLVEQDGAPIASGSMAVVGDVALLAGASTIPVGRGLGAQALLLAARLAEARRRGCALAMMVTSPGSTSQRNAERRGFRVAYTRTKWRLARSG